MEGSGEVQLGYRGIAYAVDEELPAKKNGGAGGEEVLSYAAFSVEHSGDEQGEGEVNETRLASDDSEQYEEKKEDVEDWVTRFESCWSARGVLDIEALHMVTRDFNATSQMYGRTIINEMYSAKKTIAPSKLGGVAGGEKFIAAGIIFKFARDVHLSIGGFLYGGASSNEEAAQKAAGHERKGLQIILQKRISRIKVPLMTLVDYRGWRLSAQSLVPLSRNSLVYGSDDGGMRIHACEGEPGHLQIVSRLSSALYLADHPVKDGSGVEKRICTPVDIEIHHHEGSFFILDTARLLPPMPPRPENVRSIFFELFRPEFLQRHKKPLSSDAFSVFGALERDHYNGDVRAAHKELVEVYIPSIAKMLQPMDVSDSVTRFLQQRGVNVRFIGLVRSHTRDLIVRRQLLVEMIARVIQKYLRRNWRSQKQFSVIPLLRTTVTILNSIHEGPAWIVAELLAKFGEKALADAERDPLTLPLGEAVLRACKLAGVVLLNGHTASACEGKLTISDISLEPVTKELNVSARAQAVALAQEARLALPHRSVELLQAAIHIMRFELLSDPCNVVLQVTLARMLLSAAKRELLVISVPVQGSSSTCSEYREPVSARSPRPSPSLRASSSLDIFTLENRDMLTQALGALMKLPDHLNDKHFLTCRYYKILSRRDMNALDAPSAIKHWDSAAKALDRCVIDDNWVSFSDLKEVRRALEAQFDKLAQEAFQCMFCVTFPTDYRNLLDVLKPRISWLRKQPCNLWAAGNGKELSDPRALWLWILLSLDEPDVVRVRLQKFWDRLSLPYNVSISPLDGEMLRVFESIGMPQLGTLVLHEGSFEDLEFAAIAKWAPSLKSLSLLNCNRITLQGLGAGLQQMAALRTLKLTGMGCLRGDLNVFLECLPRQLESLHLKGQKRVSLTDVVSPLPSGLVSFKIWDCGDLVPSVGLLKRLQELTGLRRLWLQRISATVAMLLPFTLHTIRFEADEHLLQPLPKMPDLLHFITSGKHLSDVLLRDLFLSSAHLETLRIPHGSHITDATFSGIFLQHLKDVNIAYCSQLSNSILNSFSPEQILSWDSREVFRVTSAALAPVISLDARRVRFAAPREPLMFKLGSGTSLVSLCLESTALITDNGWAALCRNTQLLESVTLASLRGFDDARVEMLILGTSKLRKLVMRNLLLVKGSCLARGAEMKKLSQLQVLTVAGTLVDEVAFCSALKSMASLRHLSLSLSAESNDMFRQLANHCRHLRSLSLYSQKDLVDASHFLPRISLLRSLELDWCSALASFQGIHRLGHLGWLKIWHRYAAKFDFQIPPRLHYLDMVRAPLPLPLILEWLQRAPVTEARLSTLALTEALELAPPLVRNHPSLARCSLYGAELANVSLQQIGDVPSFKADSQEDTSLVWLTNLYRDDKDGSALAEIRGFLPPLSMRAKWAVIHFEHDTFSVNLTTQLAQIGYQVILLYAENDRKFLPTEIMQRDCQPVDGFHWIPFDQEKLDHFQEQIAATGCRAVDFIWVGGSRPTSDGKAVQMWEPNYNVTTDHLKYMTQYFQTRVVGGHAIISLLDPFIKAAKDPKISLHIAGIGSISTVSNGHGLRLRITHAALYDMVRVYSLHYPHAIVFGAHLGLWWPGLRLDLDEVPGAITGGEAASRLVTLATQVSKEHSGWVVDSRLEIIPP